MNRRDYERNFLDGAGRRRTEEQRTADLKGLFANLAIWTDADDRLLSERLAQRNDLYERRVATEEKLRNLLYNHVGVNGETLTGEPLAATIADLSEKLCSLIREEDIVRQAASALIERKHRTKGIPLTNK